MPEPPLQLLLSSGELRFRHLKVAVKKKKKRNLFSYFANYNEAHSPLTWIIHFHDTILWEPHLHIS